MKKSPRSFRLSLWSLAALVLLMVFSRLILRWQLQFAQEMEGPKVLLIFALPALVILLGAASVVFGACALKHRKIAWLWVLPTAAYVGCLVWALVLDLTKCWDVIREAGVAFSDLVAKQSILLAVAIGALVPMFVPESWKKRSDGFVQRHKTLLWWIVGILLALTPVTAYLLLKVL